MYINLLKIGFVVIAIFLLPVQIVVADSTISADTTENQPLYNITIVTEPEEANVEIEVFDMVAKYVHGVKLPAGRYSITVSHPCYTTQNGYIDISDKDWAGKIILEPKFASQVSTKELKEEWQKLEEEREAFNAEKLAWEKMRLQHEKENRDKSLLQKQTIEQSDESSSINLNSDTKVAKLIAEIMVELKSNHLGKISDKQENTLQKNIAHLVEIAPNNPDVKRVLQLYKKRYLIVLGVFGNYNTMARMEDYLEKNELPWFVSPIKNKNRDMKRVIIGFFTNRPEVEETRRKLHKDLNIDDTIVNIFYSEKS
ncbi:MAG: SPOR domain-containing protein [Magnetococcales bacterium]|nr:SPOR domain-containing protein [Magnetococcales bacterium]